MVKKFLFSAIALIGFTVASYGANTVEVEVNESLLVEELQVVIVSPGLCDDCYEVFNIDYNFLMAVGEEDCECGLEGLLLRWERCVDRYCD